MPGLVLALVLASSTVAVTQAQAPEPQRERLNSRQLETPRFQEPARVHSGSRTIENLRAELRGRAGAEFLRRLVPSQSGVLWISLLVAMVVAVDFGNLRSVRNLELLAMLAIGFLLFDVMRFFGVLQDPTYFRLLDWVFTGVMAVSLLLIGVALWRIRSPHPAPWRPNLGARSLAALALVLLVLNVLIGLTRTPDDAGFYCNLGAQRLRERGAFPYGDPLLTGTPGAAYGPVFYLAHLPFQVLVDPKPVNSPVPERPDLSDSQPYYLPPELATQLTTVTFHLLGVAALVVAARRLATAQVGWGLAALYCGSAYVLGVGGDREVINGMTFISHIGPAAVTLLAFASLARPVLSGAFLAASVATLFYPVFFIPAWIGYYWGHRAAVLRFVGGMALAAVVVGVPVLARSQPAGDRGLIGTILHDTLGHQQDPSAYGTSPFGFWGLRGGVRASLREPLVAGQYNTSPMFLLFALFVVASFFLARGRSPGELALLTAALGIGAQLWKIHGTGAYVAWYYPFLLLGLFTDGQVRAAGTSDRTVTERGAPRAGERGRPPDSPGRAGAGSPAPPAPVSSVPPLRARLRRHKIAVC